VTPPRWLVAAVLLLTLGAGIRTAAPVWREAGVASAGVLAAAFAVVMTVTSPFWAGFVGETMMEERIPVFDLKRAAPAWSPRLDFEMEWQAPVRSGLAGDPRFALESRETFDDTGYTLTVYRVEGAAGGGPVP
jgi:hypothetical protein